MSAKPPKAFDVWFQAANTVYKGVPYNVVADWTQQGRLSRTDKVRPAGTTAPWAEVGDNEWLFDYVPRPSPARAVPAAVATVPLPDEPVADAAPQPAAGEVVELPDPEPAGVSRPEDDDEVDMIPLIDISMVLLVFFIMIQAAGALAPVDVPEMTYTGQLSNDPGAITVTIDKKNTTEIAYSVRVGAAAPGGDYGFPEDLDKTVAAVRALAAEGKKANEKGPAPEVRIACHKDLPRERVYELRRALEPEVSAGRIAGVVATVVEVSEK